MSQENIVMPNASHKPPAQKPLSNKSAVGKPPTGGKPPTAGGKNPITPKPLTKGW